MENKLQVIVRDSKLTKAKADVMLEKFQNYFKIAAEWEAKAKTIKVTDASQVTEMKIARTGRLFLKEKRTSVERTRKELKEQALREGKAIDGIANVLKALIIPIEEYLDSQEKFVERQAAEKAEQERIDAERKIEEDRIAAEKADAEEKEKLRLENVRLKQEAEEREKKAEAEREKAERKHTLLSEATQRKQEEILRNQKEDSEWKQAQQEAKANAEKERIEQEAEAKAKKERDIAAKKREKEAAKLAAERKEKERLAALLKNQIECPYCHKKFVKKGV